MKSSLFEVSNFLYYSISFRIELNSGIFVFASTLWRGAQNRNSDIDLK